MKNKIDNSISGDKNNTICHCTIAEHIGCKNNFYRYSCNNESFHYIKNAMRALTFYAHIY